MDQTKLRALLQEHHTSAWGWALYCNRGDRDAAEETLHNAYLQILEGKASFDGRSAFRTWLFAVIRKMTTWKRSQLARSIERFKGGLQSVIRFDREADENLYRSELRSKVVGLLAGLSNRQAEVLQLVFYHGLTVEEAAGVMGVSVGSARTHYQRGKDRLRIELEKAGITP